MLTRSYLFSKLKFYFRDRDTLWQLKTFWWGALTPLGVALLIGGYIGFDLDLDWDFSTNGINNLSNFFIVPINIALLSFPILAIEIANHRSVQTYKQLNSAQRQISLSIEYNKMSVRPLLNDVYEFNQFGAKWTLTNKGLGTAKIDSIKIFKDENILMSPKDFILDVKSHTPKGARLSCPLINKDIVLSKDESAFIFALKGSDTIVGDEFYNSVIKFSELAHYYKIEIEYSSMYGEKFNHIAKIDLDLS